MTYANIYTFRELGWIGALRRPDPDIRRDMKEMRRNPDVPLAVLRGTSIDTVLQSRKEQGFCWVHGEDAPVQYFLYNLKDLTWLYAAMNWQLDRSGTVR